MASEETSVSTFRQKSRTLPTLANMIRDIDAVRAKSETASEAELVNEPLHQIATVETGVANIMLENARFRGWTDDDLTYAYTSAHVTAQIAAATPPAGGGGSDHLEAILLAAETVAAAGYSANVLEAAPEDLIDLMLLQQPGTAGGYIFTGGVPLPLEGLRVGCGVGAPDADGAGHLGGRNAVQLAGTGPVI